MKNTILFLVAYMLMFHSVAHGQDVRTVVQTGHIVAVTDYDVSADGRYLASVDKSHKVVLWDLQTGHQMAEIHDRQPRQVFFASKPGALTLIVKGKQHDFYDVATMRRIYTTYDKSLEVKSKPENIQVETSDNIIKVTHGTRQLTLSPNADTPTSGFAQVSSNDSRWWICTQQPMIWDVSTGKLNRVLDHIERPGRMFFDRDTHVVFWNGQEKLLFLDALSGSLISEKKIGGTGELHHCTFLSDGETVVYDRDNQIWWTNLKTQKSQSYEYLVKQYYDKDKLEEVKYYPNQPANRITGFSAMPQPNQFRVLVNSIFCPVTMTLGNPVMKYGANLRECMEGLMDVSVDSCIFVVGQRKAGLYMGQVLFTEYERLHISASTENYSAITMFYNKQNKDGLAAVGTYDGYIDLYGSLDGIITNSIKCHEGRISHMSTAQSLREVLTISDDGSVGLFDGENLQIKARLISMNGGADYIIITPDHYYMATRGAVDALHFVKGMETFSFDQFDLKYNRPDIVLSRLGHADPKTLSLYARAYTKRLKKMNYTEDMLSEDFHVPTVSVTNADQLRQSTDAHQTLRLTLSDTRYALSSLHVTINGVPIFGHSGKALKGSKNETLEVELELAKGRNVVQVSCMNDHGAESRKESIEVNLKDDGKLNDLYIVSVGVSVYADQRFNLSYAAKDANDVMQKIQKVNTRNYANIHRLLLTDTDVTLSNVGQIREFLSKAGRNDAVVLFYAGHGLVDEQLDYYLATHDTDFANPSACGLAYEDFEQLLDGILPLKKLLLIDACHSGEIDKEDMLLAQAQKQTKVTQPIVFRSAGDKIPTLNNVSSEQVNLLMAELFTNLQHGVGATVISSASGQEVAMEGDEWRNGLFSYVLMNAFNDKSADTDGDGLLNVTELQAYCQQRVLSLSQGRQRPTLRSENYQQNFNIGKNR